MRREPYTHTGQALRDLRKALDFSVEELAEVLGTSRTTVTNRELKAAIREDTYQQHRAALLAMDKERSARFKTLP